MTFVATKSWVINAPAGNNSYVLWHPTIPDMGNTNINTTRAQQVEVANQSATPVYVALDRAGSFPTGNGVYGSVKATAGEPPPTPLAATPGDFDFAVTSNTGWSALDYVIPQGSVYMTVLTTGAGLVSISYGAQI
jgi:hypothetical protein